jgi:Pyrroline-5-carboxylate reductase
VGEKECLSYESSLSLISQTLIGSGYMIQESKKTPQALIDDVSSPGGTTVAGLTTFQKSDIASDLEQVIQSAINRARELSKE